MMQRMAREAEEKKGKIPVKVMVQISPHHDLLYAGDGWSEYLPPAHRTILQAPQKIGLFGSGYEKYKRFLPPSYAQKSVKRQMLPMVEARRRLDWLSSHRVFKRERWKFIGVYDNVYETIKRLVEMGFVVPLLWRDPPYWLKARYGRPVIDRYGRVIYDVWEQPTRAIKNPEVFEMKDYEIRREFAPFPQGYRPNVLEREERVMRFLELYVEYGHMIAAAKAVGVQYYQLLLWANESEALQAQVAMAEHAVRQHVRSNATVMALNGDKQMITLLMREQMEEKKLGKKFKVDAPEMADETTAAIGIAQRAIDAMNRAQLPSTGDVSDELPPQALGEAEELPV